jgi:hypothetical protein
LGRDDYYVNVCMYVCVTKRTCSTTYSELHLSLSSPPLRCTQTLAERKKTPDTPRKMQMLPPPYMSSNTQIQNIKHPLLADDFSVRFRSSPQHQTSKPNGRHHRQRARPHDGAGVGVGPAARAVVSHVVPLGGNFENGARVGAAAIVVVHQQEIGRGAVVSCKKVRGVSREFPFFIIFERGWFSFCCGIIWKLTAAVHRHGSQLPLLLSRAVGVVDLRRVGQQQRLAQGARQRAQLDRHVQVVVGHVHEILVGVVRVELGRPLDGAGESGVLGRKGRLPHVRELFQDVRHAVLVGVVVHEHDDAVVAEDHLAERRPLVLVLRDVHGRVEVLGHAGVFDRDAEFFDKGQVRVADEHCEDFEGVVLEPGDDCFELGLEGPRVEQVAGGVAVVEGFVDVVDLALDCERGDFG